MKILDRGYWISKHFYWQSLVHWFANGIRFRSMTFFSAGNPAINLGGMLSDKKTEFYDILPQHLLPATTITTNMDDAKAFMQLHGLQYPMIIKPNTGLKGMMVEKLYSDKDLQDFFADEEHRDREWLLQEFLGQEREFAVLFYKYPKSGKYGISSFIEKIYPSLTADGKHTYRELIDAYKNPFLEKAFALKKFAAELDNIPGKGTKIVLDEIGNYSRGAKFFSLNEEVDAPMVEAYYDHYKELTGLNFFRIDCKADTLEDCKNGNYKILEVNGMKGEPLHIYDPKSTFFGNVKALRLHWSHIQQVVKEQEDLIKDAPTFAEGVRSWRSLVNQFKSQ